MKNKFVASIIESFFYCFIVYLFFFHFSKFKADYLTLNLHPLVVVIAFIALRYGTYSGFVSVFFAFFFYILAYYKLGNDPVIFFYTFENYKFLLIFFFTALFLGKTKDKANEKIMDLAEENKKNKEDFENQKENNLKLLRVNERLKSQIISSKESILTLHHMISSMFDMKVEQIYTKTVENLMQFLNCDVVSIYSYNDNKKTMSTKIKVGKNDMPNFFLIEESEIPFKEILKTKETKEFFQKEKETSPIYVAPIIKGEEIVGFLNVERLKYSNREKYLFELFKVLTEWMNKSLSSAFLREEEEIQKNIYKGTRILNMEYFNERLIEEEKRKKILNTEYIVFESKNPGISSEELDLLIAEKIRETNLIGMDKNFIRILFINISERNKITLIEKLKSLREEVDFYEV